MGDDKLPRIPSFAELGISEDEIEELEREIEQELEEARAKEEGRDPVPVPEGQRGKAEAGAAKPAQGKDKTTEKKRRGKGFGFGGRRKKKATRGRTADVAAGAEVAGSGEPRKGRGDSRGAAAGSRPGDPERRARPGSEREAGAKPDPAPEASPAPVPWNGTRGYVTFGLLLVMAWFSSSFRTIPSPVPATAPDSVFSSGRAMSHLVRIASEAHPPGSPAHADVREYLLAQLRALGLEPSVQTATSAPPREYFTRVATVRNILARIPGSQPGGRAVLVTAHYDSREISPGAADDASGVVTILESLRALGAGPPLRNDLVVLITDAEELGLLGAEAFVREHPWLDDVALVISIEMRGGGGPSMMFETGAENGWAIDALRRANPRPAANSIAFEIYKRMPNDTDFTPFKKAGKQGLNFAGVARANVYHQVYDSPENLDEGTLQHHGVQVLAMLREFGNADLSAVNAPDKSYLSVPVLGLVTYGTFWIWVLGLATVVLWGVALVVVRLGGARIGGFVAGFLASVVQLGGVGAVGYFLFAWRRGAHPEFGALDAGAFHSEGWYVLAIVGVAFVLATLSLTVLRRWFSTDELAVGALFVPVLLAAVTTVVFPMAAVNIQWPALAGCAGALVVTKVGRNGRAGLLRWIGAVVAALPVVVVLTPLTEAVWLAMGLGPAPLVAALVGLLLLQIVPLLDTQREPNGWWAPVAGLVLTGIFLAVGMSTARPSADRPAPSTLVYLMDRETGSAWWGTDPDRDASDPGVAWASAAVGPFDAGGSGEVREAVDAEDPGESAQVAQVRTFTRSDETAVRRAMMTARPAEALRTFTSDYVRYALAAAEPAEIPPPDVAVVTDSAAAGGLLRISVTSRIGAEMMLFRPGDTSARLAAINGKTVPGGEGSWRMEHWGEPEGGILLDFEPVADGDGVLRFAVIEHHLRPGELVGNTIFARPDNLAPNIHKLSDRAMIRTIVSVDVATGEVTFVRATEPDAEEEVDEAGEGVAESAGGEGEAGAAAGDSADVAVEDTVTVADATSDPADTTSDPADTTTTPPDTGSVRRR